MRTQTRERRPFAAALAFALALASAGVPASAGARRSVEGPLPLPPHERMTLGNGMRVMVVEDHELPLVSLRLLVFSGSSADPAGQEGLARLVGMTLTQGTDARSASQIAELIDSLGGTLEVEVGEDATAIEARVLSRDFDAALDLLADAVMHATFPDEEVARQRELLLGVIAEAGDDPEATADAHLTRFLFGSGTYGHPVRGEENTVRSLEREDCVRFHRERYVPPDAVLALVGDVERRAAAQAVGAAFQGWSGSAASAAPATAGNVRNERVLLVDKPDATQSQVRVASVAIARDDPDFVPAQVANTILGGTFFSRLMNVIRVDRGLTYSIFSGFEARRSPGPFVISTFTRNEKIVEMLDAILEQVALFGKDGAAGRELSEAQDFLVGTTPRRFETGGQVARRLLEAELYGVPLEQILDQRRLVREVTLEDVRRVARERMRPDSLRIVVLGPAEQLRPLLERYGPIAVLTTEEGL